MDRRCSPDLPGERQRVCVDLPLADERRPKLVVLLLATEGAVSDPEARYKAGALDYDKSNRQFGTLRWRKMA